jgi:hypothetical protein
MACLILLMIGIGTVAAALVPPLSTSALLLVPIALGSILSAAGIGAVSLGRSRQN